MRRYTMCLSLIVIAISLSSCAREEFSPGPKGPIGPQGDLGPKGTLGPSSSDAIVIEDTGELVQREYPLRGFSQVEVSDFFTVEVHQGETYRVMVEADEALTPYLDVVVRGKTLHIGLKSNLIYNIEKSSHRVEVTLPAMTHARITDFGTMDLTGLKADDTLKLEVTDFGELDGAIDAKDVQVVVSNHSSLNPTGSASRVMGEVTDFSSADLTGLKAPELDIDTDTRSTLVH